MWKDYSPAYIRSGLCWLLFLLTKMVSSVVSQMFYRARPQREKRLSFPARADGTASAERRLFFLPVHLPARAESLGLDSWPSIALWCHFPSTPYSMAVHKTRSHIPFVCFSLSFASEFTKPWAVGWDSKYPVQIRSKPVCSTLCKILILIQTVICIKNTHLLFDDFTSLTRCMSKSMLITRAAREWIQLA